MPIPTIRDLHRINDEINERNASSQVQLTPPTNQIISYNQFANVSNPREHAPINQTANLIEDFVESEDQIEGESTEIDSDVKLEKDLSILSDQFAFYKHISEAVQRIKKFNFDVNDFVYNKINSNVKELLIYRIAEYDYLNEKVLLSFVNDQNFSSFSSTEFGFCFFKTLLEKVNTNESELKKLIQDNIFEVDINKIEDDYYVFLSYEHILFQLHKEKKYDINIFSDIHRFIEKNFLKNQIAVNFSKNPQFLTIIIILYYMDTDGYSYDFENNVFIKKNVSQNNFLGDLI